MNLETLHLTDLSEVQRSQTYCMWWWTCQNFLGSLLASNNIINNELMITKQKTQVCYKEQLLPSSPRFLHLRKWGVNTTCEITFWKSLFAFPACSDLGFIFILPSVLFSIFSSVFVYLSLPFVLVASHMLPRVSIYWNQASLFPLSFPSNLIQISQRRILFSHVLIQLWHNQVLWSGTRRKRFMRVHSQHSL